VAAISLVGVPTFLIGAQPLVVGELPLPIGAAFGADRLFFLPDSPHFRRMFLLEVCSGLMQLGSLVMRIRGANMGSRRSTACTRNVLTARASRASFWHT
jgi:hypothetical protein